MKKVFTCFLVLVALFAIEREAMAAAVKKSVSPSTLQDDLGVQAVGGNAEAEPIEPMRFDDVTFGQAYKIDGYASITLLGFKFINMFAQWNDGKAGREGVEIYDNGRHEDYVFRKAKQDIKRNKAIAYANCQIMNSGEEADFAWLKVNITNLQKTSVHFMQEIKVKVIYDDEYEYDGWVRQFNYDYANFELYSYNRNAGVIGWPVCLSPVDEMPIKQLYEGHYAFGCTLPNFIVEDRKSPLRMVIKIGEHELTYNIR